MGHDPGDSLKGLRDVRIIFSIVTEELMNVSGNLGAPIIGILAIALNLFGDWVH